MDPEVDAYIERSTMWPDELRRTREVLLGCGLDEQIKWNKPCYSSDGANVAILQEMKGFLALMFFKGALLDDPAAVLRSQGPNSRSAKRVELTSVEQIEELASVIADLVAAAVAVEAAGLRVPEAPPVELVAELAERLARDPELAAAFDRLTPGRQREYNLHIGQAKQASTRESRIDKHVERIKAGKGLRDR
jgi:uncharacterized protein YdeI (YjbR/CyaY-like superfamily)